MATNNSCNYKPTQYNVQVGSTNGFLDNVAPSATTGVPLISQGAAANPAFGTAVVAGGGTGNTTFTAYSVIAAGTTSTGAFQNVSGVGTSGQVLTSNGAGTLPTWQDASGPPDPFTTISVFEDFLVSPTATGQVSPYLITNTSTTLLLGTDASTTNPGTLALRTASSTTGTSTLSQTVGGNSTLFFSGGAIELSFIAKISALSDGTDTYKIAIGFGDANTVPAAGADFANGAWFHYTHSDNSGAWIIKTASASSVTSQNTATTVDTDWHKYTLQVNAGATSISFLIDDVEVTNSPLTTNIPTANPIGCFIGIRKSAGTTSRYIAVDLFTFDHTLTSARY